MSSLSCDGYDSDKYETIDTPASSILSIFSSAFDCIEFHAWISILTEGAALIMAE